MVDRLAGKLMTMLKQKGLSIVTAESCTAGLLAKTLSDAPGAAAHFCGGYVTYTKQQKTRALGVSARLLATKGAVCPEVARAMVRGALAGSVADIAIAITGVAGPDPDEDGNPVGKVIIAAAFRGKRPVTFVRHYRNSGRHSIRRKTVSDAIERALAVMPPKS
jgi:nicotinamide-nucleotide amidase